ncbi:energy-coupling factor transport system permease protein [Diaminobutyricimonas aerilata]|uniref:Energy-coupling factor transport system permease protein n=1 Tax=Diaminobutyricimonas aerilata TaxID=1162967 RepID=A0A2M9CJ34_9MICO|nr:energy-coupling factor transporter transmembrane component T [Diaminobutyricimonas aerilata]PJJ71878.1 energy-coupling factor transport system permease protein [Diaminobutyricimonas aerilata]
MNALARVNPVTAFAAALVLSVSLLVSLDIVTASVALAAELLLIPFAGVPWRTFWVRTAPVWIAAPLAGVTTALYGEDSGRVRLELGFVTVTDGSLELAAVIALRVLAAGIPAIVLFITVDLTRFADGLAQLLHLPARFVLGALAGLRLVGLFVEDWRALELARRARGVADRGRVRRFAGQAFALLVLSVRRGTKLATAMEAKGFRTDAPRTWARPSSVGRADAVLMLLAIVIVVAAIVTSVSVGAWRSILG